MQVVFKDAAQQAAEYDRAWVAENEAAQLQEMKDNDMEVIEDPDLDAFKAAVQSVYDAYPDYAENLAKIQEAAAAV